MKKVFMVKKFLGALPLVPVTDSLSYVLAWQMPMGTDPRITELEHQLKRQNPKHPDRPPRRCPGDGYTILGAIAGLIAGFILGGNSNSLLMFIVFFIGGGIVGTILGSFVRPLINRLKQSRTKKSEEQQGPFA